MDWLGGIVGGVRPGPLLDVGFGTGSFVRRAVRAGWDAYGLEVNPEPCSGVRALSLAEALTASRWRVVTFFDSLEHHESLDDVRKLTEVTDWLFISSPLPPPWFPQRRSWKHFKPGEHHFYFGQPWSYEWAFLTDRAESRLVYAGFPEDRRRGARADDSTLTVALRCQSRSRA
jgi:hypothetical protein